MSKPIPRTRANLIEIKLCPSLPPEERCRLNGLPFFFVLVLILFCSAAAQDFSGLWLVNQLSATAGRTFVSTQTIENDSSSLDPGFISATRRASNSTTPGG